MYLINLCKDNDNIFVNMQYKKIIEQLSGQIIKTFR